MVANIDTGVQFNHPALVGKYRGNLGGGNFDHNYNFFDPANICPGDVPCDNNGHGTHTMGTMVGDDGAGNQIGVAPGAKWIAAKGCETTGCSEGSLLAAGQWVVAPTDINGQNPRPDLRPDIVNNSWGGGRGDDWYEQTVAAWRRGRHLPQLLRRQRRARLQQHREPGRLPQRVRGGLLRHQQQHLLLLRPGHVLDRRLDQAEHLRAGQQRPVQRSGRGVRVVQRHLDGGTARLRLSGADLVGGTGAPQ